MNHTGINLRPLDLLTHANVFVRALASWGIGLMILFSAWVASYLWLPAGGLRFGSSNPVLAAAGEGVMSLALALLGWNLLVAASPIALSSLFAVGRLPAGYLMPWVTCAAYGGMLGTNSFALPDPAGPSAPSLAVLWTRAGLREITAYLLIAAALSGLYLWRQSSWWSLRVKQVRPWRSLRVSLSELTCLVAAAGLLGWAAYVEAWQIVSP